MQPIVGGDILAAASVVTLPAFAPDAAELAPALALPGRGNALNDFCFKLGSQLAAKGIYYMRGGCFMRVDENKGRLEQVNTQSFRTEASACNAARFMDEGQFSNMTADTAAAVLNSRIFQGLFPEIARVSAVRLPVVRPDGRLELLPHGFDTKTRILVLPGVDFDEKMPEAEARKFLDELIADFPWPEDRGEAERGRARMLAAMLAAFVSGIVAPWESPVYFFHANAEGSGKTLAARLCVCPVFGPAVVKTFSDAKGGELQKLLDATALGGAGYLLLDNLKGKIESAALEAFSTARIWGGRVLSQSKDFEVERNALLFLTGNNAMLSPDMGRRSVHVFFFMRQIDSRERPRPRQTLDETRILEERGRILGALFAIVRKWDEAGRPPAAGVMPTMERWTALVGGMVQSWSGVDVFAPAPETMDPVLRDFVAWISGLDVPAGSPLQIEQSAVRESWIASGLFKDLFPAEETDGNAASYEQRARKIFKRFDGRTSGGRRFDILPDSRPRKVQITAQAETSCSGS